MAIQLTPSQVGRIFEITDALDLHRNWVIVPIKAAERGREIVQPDGKLLILAPGGEAFEPWFAGLRRRLEGMDLSRTPRADRHDPAPPRFLVEGPVDAMSARYFKPGGTSG